MPAQLSNQVLFMNRLGGAHVETGGLYFVTRRLWSTKSAGNRRGMWAVNFALVWYSPAFSSGPKNMPPESMAFRIATLPELPEHAWATRSQG